MSNQELEQEIIILKKRLFRQQVFMLSSVLFTVFVFAMLLAKKDFNHIRVNHLDILSKGQVVLSLGSSESGAGSLSTFSQEGDRLIDLSRTANGGAMTTYSINGKESIECSATQNGGFIGTYDMEGKPLLEMSRTGYGGDLRLFNRFGRVSVKASTVTSGGVIAARNEKDDTMVYFTRSDEIEDED